MAVSATFFRPGLALLQPGAFAVDHEPEPDAPAQLLLAQVDRLRAAGPEAGRVPGQDPQPEDSVQVDVARAGALPGPERVAEQQDRVARADGLELRDRHARPVFELQARLPGQEGAEEAPGEAEGEEEGERRKEDLSHRVSPRFLASAFLSTSPEAKPPAPGAPYQSTFSRVMPNPIFA